MAQEEAFSIELTGMNLDMTDMYNLLTSQYADDMQACPMVAVVENLPDKKTAIRLNDRKGTTRVILLKQAKGIDMLGNLYKELTAPSKETEDFPEDCAFYYEAADLFDLYGHALELTQAIGIPCPQIIHTRNMPVNGAKSFPLLTPGDHVNTIFLKEDENITMEVYALAYELRKSWQRLKHSKLYYTDYQELKPDAKAKEREAFQLQKAEIDAEAFALRYLSHALDSKVFAGKQSDKVNALINERAAKLAVPFNWK